MQVVLPVASQVERIQPDATLHWHLEDARLPWLLGYVIGSMQAWQPDLN
jgi:hypothetical protein